MKIRLSVTVMFVFITTVAIYSQKIITLRECYDLAMKKTSLAGEKKAYSDIWQLKNTNLSRGWLPSIDANANFIYNSDVVDMRDILSKLPIPGIASAIKPLPNEQYKITLDINQVIYDGGAIKGAKAAESADLAVNKQQTEVDLYKIRAQVYNCYFALLLQVRQKELLNTYLDLIVKRLNSMQSALNNGVIIKSDVDVLTSEKIRIEQQLSESDFNKASLISILSDLTGSAIDPQSEFIMPQPGNALSYEISRPELKAFDLRKEQLNAGLNVIQSKRMPLAFGFATLGYGNPPGSDFFKNEFAPYYIIGAGVRWHIFDWNQVKNEKQQIKIQQEIIEHRKTDLSDNLKRMLQSKNAEITSLQSLIEKDSELIAIRKRITTVAESRYENGTITATDYLNELNSERQAMIDFEIHKINLALARIEFLNISGKEIE
jgi:outer membrane protein TolC